MALRLTVEGICNQLGVTNAAEVSAKRIARRLALFSGGRVGYIANLLVAAWINARKENTTEITQAHLRVAVDEQSLQSTGPGYNPFALEDDDKRLLSGTGNDGDTDE